MSDEVEVAILPKCDLCDQQAAYDGKMHTGPWANLCARDFAIYGVGLGTGRGQRLVLKKEK